MQSIKLSVNGQLCDAMVTPDESLLHLLRERLKLMGTKEGCSTGYCGACTVLVEGDPVNACLYFAVDADRRTIITVEGLEASDGSLHPLQRSFIEAGGLQCGFCTPGMLLSALALLAQHPLPTESEVRAALSGNICRCTGYQSIVQAVLAAAHLRENTGSAGTSPRITVRLKSRA